MKFLKIYGVKLKARVQSIR